jgi:uncharacterized protein (TIGR02679 family)
MEAGRPLRETIVRVKAGADERRAVDNLLGRKSTTGAQLTLDLAVLEDTLRATGLIDTLEEVVFACHGPVENRRAQNERLRSDWQTVFDAARKRCRGKVALLEWIDALAGDGTLKRLSRGDFVAANALLDSAFQILERNPCAEVLLANLGADCAGDSHALDRGQPLATLCLRGIARVYGIDGQRSADDRRKAWAAAGVVIDDLSAPVLVFNLCAVTGSALEEVLQLYRQQGQPAFLTYRQLQGSVNFEPLDSKLRIIYVCENPSIVSAAARELGLRCQPLICTNGQPTSAVRLLISQLRQAGAELRCHADFDWAGLRIVDQLVREHFAIPWRMQAEDYRNYLGTVALTSQSFFSEWSPELADALRANNKAVFEEQMIRVLLDDLENGAG